MSGKIAAEVTGKIMGVGAGVVVSPLVGSVIGSTIATTVAHVVGFTVEKLAATAAERRGPALLAKIRGRSRKPPVNHDLLRAVRRSWLCALSLMAEDVAALVRNNKRSPDELLLEQSRTLHSTVSNALRELNSPNREVQWAGWSEEQILGLYDEARAAAIDLSHLAQFNDLTKEGSPLTLTEVAQLALADIAQFLNLDGSLVHEALKQALTFGWRTLDSNDRQFVPVVTAFLLEELKTSPAAQTANNFLLNQHIIDLIKQAGENVETLSSQLMIDRAFDQPPSSGPD